MSTACLRRHVARSRAHVFIWTVALALLLQVLLPVAAQQNPYGLSKQQLALLSAGAPDVYEMLMGPFHIAEFESKNSIFRDPRVDRIAERLQRHCGRKGLRIRAVRDGSVNAVIYPGGGIYIHTGLLGAVGADDDALAFVIGHEIGHAGRYHTGSIFAQQIVVRRLVNQLSDRNTSLDARRLIIQLGRAAFTRDHEREADNDALRLMTAAGFDPEGAFRCLALFGRSEPAINFWLRDHPSSEDRIRRLRDFARQQGIRVGETTRSETEAPPREIDRFSRGTPRTDSSISSGPTSVSVREGEHRITLRAPSGWRPLSETEVQRRVEATRNAFPLAGSIPGGARLTVVAPQDSTDDFLAVLTMPVPGGGLPPAEQMRASLAGLTAQVRSSYEQSGVTVRVAEDARLLGAGQAEGARMDLELTQSGRRVRSSLLICRSPHASGTLLIAQANCRRENDASVDAALDALTRRSD